MKWSRLRNSLCVFMMHIILLSAILPTGSTAAAKSSSETVTATDQNSIETSQANQMTTKQSNRKSRYIVTYKKAPGNSRRSKSQPQMIGTLKRENKHISSVTATLTSLEVEDLRKSPDIESIEPDIQIKIATQTIDWGVTATQATYAWHHGYTGKGVKVAVLDTGIDSDHDDLVLAGGVSFVDYTVSYDDDNGHGTNVAGIIGAQNNDIGVVGMAPFAKLYAIKVLDATGTGYLSDLIAGIDWSIENNMDIINLSLNTTIDSPALHRAVDEAYRSGLLVVAAAGNSGNEEGTGDTMQYPAKYNSVISVGAVDVDNKRAKFSATGERLELVAPGVDVLSTGLNNTSLSVNGTSFSAPYVTGALALLKEEHVSLTNVELRNLLLSKASDIGDPGRDNKTGYGVIQLSLSGRLGESPSVSEDVYVPTVTREVYEGIVTIAGTDKIVTYSNFYPEVDSYPYGYTGIGIATLKDGRVLMSGGANMWCTCGGNITISAAWLYDPLSNSMTKAVNLPTKAAHHKQITLPDGRVYILGISVDGNYYYNAYFYDPVGGKYTPAPYASIKINQSTLLADGRIALFSRDLQNSTLLTHVLNPQNGDLVQVATSPINFSDYTVSTLKDGRVFVAGNVAREGNKSAIYDPVRNTWTEAAVMPGYYSGMKQVTLLDGRVAVIGQSKVYLYDPVTNTWAISPLAIPASIENSSSVTVLNDGRILVLGGRDLNGRYFTHLHLITINTSPKVFVNNTNQTVYRYTGNPVFTLTGTLSDLDNDSVTVSATIAGVTKSVVVSNTNGNPTWKLEWNANTDNIPHGPYTNIPVSGNDGVTTVSALYTGTIAVDHNRAPNVPNLVSPVSTNPSVPHVIPSAGTVLVWNFSDPDVGDIQSGYQILVYSNANSQLVLDTGWISSNSGSYTLAGGSLRVGETYYWKVRVKDGKNGISGYSNPSYIKVNTPPKATITSYTDGQELTDNILTFTWAYSDTEGQPQKQYQVLGSKDNWSSVGYQSGVITSTGASHTTSPLTNGNWSFAVLVSDGLDWSARSYRNNLKLPNALEPNDTFGSAFPVMYNNSFSSIINASTDVDFFKYTTASNGIDRIVLEVPADQNYDIHVYDAAMNLIASGIKGTGQPENILFDVRSGSTYYVKIIGANGHYNIAVPYKCTITKLTMTNQTQYEYDSNGNIKSKRTTNP